MKLHIPILAKSLKISELSVFGSVLNDNFNNDSDVDLLVTFSPSAHYSYFDILDIKELFENALGRKVDLIEKASIKNPFKRAEIINNSKVIYAA